ncbi:hypothetical protein LPJ81_006399, partial [Coemansia sp. IMI 209127]
MTSSALAAPAPANPATISAPPVLPYSSVRAATRERMQSKEEEETVYSSDPGSISNPPALPYSAKRTAIKEQSREYEYESHSSSNPADALNAPSLPLRQGSRLAAEPFDPIENKMQPSPQHLISRINSGSNIQKSGGFEDSFEPFKKQSSAPTALTGRPIPQAVSKVASNSNGPLSVGSPADGFNRTATYHSSSSYSSSVTTTTSMDSRTSIPDDARSRYAHLFTKLNKQFGKRGYLTTSEVRAV